MLGRAVFVSVLMVSGVLVGCIGGTEEPKIENQTSTNNTLLPNETVAPDGRGSISAFNETNKTETKGIGAMMHTHDYWKGKERLDVGYIDAGLIPFPLAPCKRPNGDCSVGSTTPATGDGGDTYPVGTAIADFLKAPRSQLIPEGTKQLELKLTKFTGPTVAPDPAPAPPPNPAGQVFFDYLAANDEPGKFHKGGELKLNQPFLIDLKPTDADMPHQTASLWIYRIYSNSQMVWFEFNITITAIKGYDVVNWPPHPDLYAEKPDRTVFEGPVKLTSKGTVDSNLFGSDAGWTHPEKVISWGTDSIDIEFAGVTFNSQTSIAPTGWVFEYNNASKPPLLGNGAQYSARLKDPGSDGKSYHFHIDLKADRGDAYDTPYAQYSRWGFRLVPQFDQAQAGCYDDPLPEGRFIQQFLVGCQFVPWDAAYTMKIVAHGHSIAAGVPQSAQ
jgi:hypothetical protein